MDKKRGAYVLYFDVKLPLTLNVGSLGSTVFPIGRYAYVGSARRGIAARVSRHKRLAAEKAGKIHWHIDYLLANPHTQWAGEALLENGIECRISKRIAAMSGITVPVPGFGSSDCRAGCRAHLYRLPSEKPESLKSLFAKPSSRKGNSKSFESGLKHQLKLRPQGAFGDVRLFAAAFQNRSKSVFFTSLLKAAASCRTPKASPCKRYAALGVPPAGHC